MTEIRLVRRTHYQVLEPAFLRILIQDCTSPVSSDFPDRVAKRLSDSSAGLNLAASKYAVDLAKALNLLNLNLVWTNLGHLLNITSGPSVPDFSPALTSCEKILFLRIFLEFDGAALIFFAKKIAAERRVPGGDEDWLKLAQQLYLDTYDQYLQFMTDTQMRVKVRQLAERRRSKPFEGKSGPHQCLIHIHTLYRLGIAEKPEVGNARVYESEGSKHESRSRAAKLVEEIPDLRTLENIVSDRRWYEVANRVLGNAVSQSRISYDDFVGKVTQAYGQIMETGVTLCPLQTLVEMMQIHSLEANFELLGYQDAMGLLRRMQNEAPKEIRFHVDRFGRPAYITL